MIGNLGRLVACLTVLTVLVACGGGNGSSQSSPTEASSTATPGPTPTPVAVTLGEVVWTTAVNEQTGAPTDSLTTLPNSAPRVYAAVQAELLPAGVPVQAHWTIDGDVLPELEPAAVVAEADRAAAWISWSLTWNADEPWPIGTLGIVIEVKGETEAASEILIVRDTGAEDD